MHASHILDHCHAHHYRRCSIEVWYEDYIRPISELLSGWQPLYAHMLTEIDCVIRLYIFTASGKIIMDIGLRGATHRKGDAGQPRVQQDDNPIVAECPGTLLTWCGRIGRCLEACRSRSLHSRIADNCRLAVIGGINIRHEHSLTIGVFTRSDLSNLHE